MEDFTYKEYSEDESRVYDEAMDKIMEGMRSGLTFYESYSAVIVEDEQLKEFIIDDALKIMIADIHYTKGLSLQHVADTLRISMDRIHKANSEMVEDISITAAEIYKMNNPGGPVGNA